MPRLILVNGPPGIGKSTLARRYVEEHPGVLNCDIDVLRALVGGWADAFGKAGELIRPAALAMITAYLSGGNDVLLPQMLLRTSELAKFESSARAAGAGFVETILMDEQASVVARFHRRGDDGIDVAWHRQVQEIVRSQGGDGVLVECHDALTALAGQRPDAVVIQSRAGDVEGTYRQLLAALEPGDG